MNDTELLSRMLEVIKQTVKLLGKCDHKDHHGYCQTHFLEKDCIVEKMENLIKESENKIVNECEYSKVTD